MTPRRFERAKVAARLRVQDEYQRDVVFAWHSAVLYSRAMVGKLPSLNELLTRTSARPSQQQLRGQVEMLSERIGIPLRPISPAAQDALRRLKERHG